MYWLFSLVVLVSGVIILFYTRKRKRNITADYEQRIKQLENSFQELRNLLKFAQEVNFGLQYFESVSHS